MRFTEEQIFKAGIIHGFLIAQHGTWFTQPGDTPITRPNVEDTVWKNFCRTNPEEAEAYKQFLSEWKRPKRKENRS
jgi:hypothetical protein